MSVGLIKLSDQVSIPTIQYASQGNAILGIRDSGKTYSATCLAEKLMAAGIPIIAFDPIGVWRYLKVPGSGPHGKGFEVVVAGDDGDLPLQPKAIVEIVRAAMRENINLVIDLYSMALSKADWRAIVESSLRLLLYENKKHGLRHIFLEEAAEFCPQKLGPESGRVYAEVEKLARMGGNASLGYTLINQRAEEVNKAVLELCDCLFLHRQKGRNSLQALEKWLAFADGDSNAQSRDIVRSLPMLPQGDCWVWQQGSDKPLRVHMPAKQSLHPDRRNPGAATAGAKAVDVGAFVARLKASLPKQDEPKPAPKVKPIQPLALPRVVEVPILSAQDRLLLESLSDKLKGALQRVDGILARMKELPVQTQLPALTKPVTQPKTVLKTVSPASSENSDVTGGLRRMMIALAQKPEGLTAKSMGLRAGFSSKSGSFGTYLGRGRAQGWIEGGRDLLKITPQGLAALGEYESLPTGQALLAYWIGELKGGAARMLEAVARAYPQSLTDAELGANSGFSHTSGSFGTYLGKLRSLELVTGNRANLRASGEFFE